MAKVKDIIKLPALRGIEVTAGYSGLDRKAEHVTVMEVPDIKQWLKGNDFLITSFYSVRKSEEEQCNLIRNLADTCCCVAVKTGKYVDQISDQVRKTADECGLPLLEIPFDMTYIDIIVSVMNLIFEEAGNTEILEKYIKDIIYENYSDDILMIERGRLFGLDVEKNCFAAVNISFRKKYVPTEQEMKAMKFLSQSMKQEIRASSFVRECWVISLKKGYLLLMEGETEEGLSYVVDKVVTEAAICGLWKGKTEALICGIGPVSSGLKGIRDTYSFSYKAMNVGRMLYRDQMIFSYEKLKMFCVLQEFLMEEKRSIFMEILNRLQSNELLDTLSVYFECGANLDKTAEHMHTHKNTIKYRLNRIQEKTGMDLKNPDENFQLYLAVLAMKLGAN